MPTTFTIPARDFYRALACVAPAAAPKSANFPALENIVVAFTADRIITLATDRYRMFMVNREVSDLAVTMGSSAQTRFMIPATAVADFKRLKMHTSTNPVEITVDGVVVSVVFDTTTTSYAQTANDFPRMERVIRDALNAPEVSTKGWIGLDPAYLADFEKVRRASGVKAPMPLEVRHIRNMMIATYPMLGFTALLAPVRISNDDQIAVRDKVVADALVATDVLESGR